MALSIGRYRIVERIAAGGMGEVYRASAEAVDGVAKEVALKVLLPELATREDFAALFVEEMKVALTLSHANVVQTFDVGRIDDRYFLAMELVDGTTLAGLLDAREDGVELAWSDRHAVTIAVEALKGLDYAHRRRGPDGRPLGLVHRDVSPSNVLVSAEGEVKVADFGIATSALRSWRSMAGTLAGKVEYMAPEQLRGEPLDRRADVWAMGVVLFEMLAGRRPFVGSYPDVVPEVVEGRRPRLRDLRDDVPERLAQVVERALEVDRERRFPNAAAMRQELEELAMALGWMLAVTDLAELVQQTRDADPEDASRRAASTGWLAVTGGSASAPVRTADGEAAISTTTASGDASRGVSATDAFDVILGRQLDRLSDDDGFSVYRTAPRLSASGAPSVTPPRGGAHLRLAVEKLPPPPRMPDVTSTQQPRSPWLALGAGVLAVLVAGGAVWMGSRAWWAPDDVAPTRTVVAPVESSLVPAPPAGVDARDSRSTSGALSANREGGGVGDGSGAGAAPDAVSLDATGDRPSARRPVERRGDGRARAQDERPQRATPRETPVQSAPSAEGALLSVNTDPWSNVFVDGRMVRATPLLRHRVTAGRHRVVVRNPGLGLERAMTVELAPGEHRRITFDLR